MRISGSHSNIPATESNLNGMGSNASSPLLNPSRKPETQIVSIGQPIWNADEISKDLVEFLQIYNFRPIQQNEGGMKSSGLFTLWHILKKIDPLLVVESGVWKGQSTWMIEKALPQANVFCIEPASEGIIYKTDRADYTTDDFLGFDWPSLGSALASTLVFFDDHQDVFPRLKLCRNLGIKAVILDDNYPEYSGNRHVSMAAILNQKQNDGMFQYPIERKFLLENVESYHMFPPIFDFSDSVTMEKSFITIPSIHGQFNSALHSELSTYWQDAASYRWTTLVRFK